MKRNILHRNYALLIRGGGGYFCPPSSKPPSSNWFGSVFIRCWHRHGAVQPAWQRAAHRYPLPDGTRPRPEWYDALSISATTTGVDERNNPQSVVMFDNVD